LTHMTYLRCKKGHATVPLTLGRVT
jgi:hypothetical protein